MMLIRKNRVTMVMSAGMAAASAAHNAMLGNDINSSMNRWMTTSTGPPK